MATKISLKRYNFVPSGYPPEFNTDFRKYIRKRDKNKCAICNRDNVVLNVHHIDYIKKNTTKLNCITLCRDCHVMLHFNCTWVQQIVWKNKLWDLVRKREAEYESKRKRRSRKSGTSTRKTKLKAAKV